MKKTRTFSIKGTVLDKHQLEGYLEQIASDHVLQNFSSKDTYPIPTLLSNFEYITKVYQLLNEHLKMKINIHPAGEWLLDNYYIIEEVVKVIQKDLSLQKYTHFVGLANDESKGFARIYILAAEMAAYTEYCIEPDKLSFMLQAYQKKKTLSMEEIWNMGIFLQIAVISNIRNVCEKIYSAQLQKYRVESIVERLVEQKPKEEQVFLHHPKIQQLGFGEMKYPFIEYMSYRLKKMGRKAYGYLEVLEEQVRKMGTDLSDVIQKEHFDIALRKVSMGNSIRSIKELLRINFQEIFEQMNGVEELLRQDPAGVYSRMDYKTKEEYRNRVQQIAKKTKISEIYIAQKILELARQEAQKEENTILHQKRSHVGYYLFEKGKIELIEKLGVKPEAYHSSEQKSKWYVSSVIGISCFACAVMGLLMGIKYTLSIGILTALLTFFPFTEIVVQMTQMILSKIVKPRLIPKLDFSGGIPQQDSTIVIVPTILSSKEKIKELMEKLEVYYLANQSDNLYFTLLGDCTSSKEKTEKFDTELMQYGKKLAQDLNEKYPDETFPKFHFLYRKRRWNEKEACFLGWERKRGLIHQFNTYLLCQDKQDFIVNTIEDIRQEQTDTTETLKQIRYIITLDADTDLILNSGLELVGAMAHLLNTPILDESKKIVVEGHALLQPTVGVDLIASRKSLFSRIYAGAGGTDCYTNAISNTYQDNFGEGIFAGKGIYDVRLFSQLLKEEIPENTVLSHDLLEGCYLRCGLATDILLMDGYPCKYNSFMTRLHRWIRGDWQIIDWLKGTIENKKGEKQKNPLNFLSKFKIIDNLRRSVLEISIVVLFLFAIVLKLTTNVTVWPFVLIGLITLWIPNLLEILNRIIYRKDGQTKQKTFTPIITGLKGNVLRAGLNFSFLIDKAYISATAIVKTLYRKYYTKQHLLEWTTAEEAEKNAKTDTISYYRSMYVSIIASVISLIVCFLCKDSFAKILFFLAFLSWALAPFFACYISKEQFQKEPVKQLKEEQIQAVMQLGKKTWQYFKDTLTKENHYLPPDNYQEDRVTPFVKRTSSTNIGLALLAVVSSYDLQYESLEQTLSLLQKMLQTIEQLSKWNGHLYNWYQIDNLQPLRPRYVSTVDSGNFVGYLYVLKQFLQEVKQKEEIENQTKQEIENQIELVNRFIHHTNFTTLYNADIDLFSIGYDVENNQLTDSYYDLLASEARQASLVAISKKDVPVRHWNHLSRTLTKLGSYKGLISWSGTAFEYLMPNLNFRHYLGSLLDESCQFMLKSQQEYTQKLGVPWGISEAAFNLKDLNSNYQYKAFGVPWLGLKRGLTDDIVVSGYGSMLALPDKPKEVLENLEKLKEDGIMGKYGIYESIDYTSSRLKYGEKQAVVKTFMAHHQGLILLSINNLMNPFILQRRMQQNPEIKAVDILLQERMPENVILTKEKKEKPEKIKYKDYENYTEKVYTKIDPNFKRTNLISNENWTNVMLQTGEGYSKYNDIYINRYRANADVKQGISFFLKNIRSKKIWTAGYLPEISQPDKYTIHYTPDSTKLTRMDGNLETSIKTFLAPNDPVEIRCLKLKNHGQEEEMIEVTGCFEPILSTQEQDIAHPAFNNLFLRYHFLEQTNSLLIERHAREEKVENLFLGVCFYTQEDTVGELEYEIDKEKFYGRTDLILPDMVKHSKPFSKTIGLVTDPIIAMRRTIRIMPEEEIKLYFFLTASTKQEEVERCLKQYRNGQTIEILQELSKAKAAEEARYLGIKGKEIETYQQMASHLFFPSPIKKRLNLGLNKQFEQKDLWKFGVSGDYPLVLVTIQEVNDIYVIEEVLKAYEFLRVKNQITELVILNEEKYGYDQYVKEALQTEIMIRQLGYLQNIRGGIFILNAHEITKQEKESLQYRANLILESSLGTIHTQLEEMEEKALSHKKNIGEEPKKQMIPKEEKIRSNHLDKKDTVENLKYYNEYGAFSNDGKEYMIKVNKEHQLPTTWSQVLANEHFGTIVTEGMGGYTWYDNSKLNRISSWNNNPVQDIPSEILYFKEEKEQKAWSLGFRPLPDENDYYITYGLGYAKFEHTCLGIVQEAEVFVPRTDKVKITLLKLRNTTPEKKKLKLLYYVKPVLGEEEVKSNGNIYVERQNQVLFAKNLYCMEGTSSLCYITTNEELVSYTGNKEFFIGKGTVQSPEALDKVSLDEQTGVQTDSCMAIQIEVELNSYETKEISLLLGAGEDLLELKNTAYQYTNLSNCRQELDKVKKQWQNLVNRMQVVTPVESMNILLNSWAIYQVIACRLWGRTGYYQSGGAFGFRDQLQDTLALKYIDPEFMKRQILLHSKHQFIEGDVLHWWHEQTQRGVRTRFSDDFLWLPYVTAEYIDFTADKKILEREEPYLEGKLLEEGEKEKYDQYLPSSTTGSLYEHCIKAIERAFHFGENGLPKIGIGDWNDGLSEVGSKGKGESVWLGFFLYEVISRFLPYIEEKGQLDKVEQYKQVQEDLKRALNKNGWDGRWYKRAFMDNGEVLGSMENEECRIDNIAQSWSVISNAGENDKKYISMESLENHLIDYENGIIKLLDPPFSKSHLEPGYIKAYLPGVRENGGQYTHGATWTIMAEAMLGFGDKAAELFRMINPIEHSRTKAAAQKYKVEPYVIAADVYGAENLIGRGGWTWYTGSASWMYKVGMEFILGMQIKDKQLTLNPCIPKEWKEYTIRYQYYSTLYIIKVKNPNGKNTGVAKLVLSKETIQGNQIRLIDDGKIHEIEAIME